MRYRAWVIFATRNSLKLQNNMFFCHQQRSCHNAKVVLADDGSSKRQSPIDQSPRHRPAFPQRSFLGGFRTPAPVRAAPPSWGRHPQTFTEPDFADMFNLGQRADVCWLACLVQACHLQSAIQRHLTQFQVSRLCRIGMRSQPARGQLWLNPDGGAYPFRVQPTDAPAFARLIPSVRMRCSRVV